MWSAAPDPVSNVNKMNKDMHLRKGDFAFVIYLS